MNRTLRFASIILAAFMGGCVVIDEPDVGTKTTWEVAAEFDADSKAANDYVARWRRGESRTASPKDEARWVAIAGQLYEHKIGPLDEYQDFALRGLKSSDPEVAGASAIALMPMRGVDVVDALFDVLESRSVNSDVRALIVDSIHDKQMRPETTREAEDEREYINGRLKIACGQGSSRRIVEDLCADKY